MTCTTDRVVIVVYPRGAGGKFLLNCLALGNQFALQDSELARQQLSGILDSDGVYELLTSRINAVNDEWNDLDLGDDRLLGEDFINALETTHYDKIQLPLILQQLVAGNYSFPIVAHSATTLKQLLKVFPFAKVLALENTAMFMHCRSDQLTTYWNTVRGSHWPRQAPRTQQEILQLPKFIQTELRDLFQNQIVQYFEPDTIDLVEQEYLGVLQDTQHYIWDCNKFLADDDDFKQAIYSMYGYFQTAGLRSHYVLQLRKAWIDKLKELING
jgi:hypothetical protein